ncbi:MAG: hypothetical protein MJH08_12070, partial [Hyphomicrobiales bacterium]|nr:hypothetical protein [Hyphomicrobiales bacterium]
MLAQTGARLNWQADRGARCQNRLLDQRVPKRTAGFEREFYSVIINKGNGTPKCLQLSSPPSQQPST